MSRRQIVGIGVALIVGAVFIGFVPVSAETYANYRLLMAALLGGTIGAGVVVVAIGLGKPWPRPARHSPAGGVHPSPGYPRSSWRQTRLWRAQEPRLSLDRSILDPQRRSSDAIPRDR